MKKTIITLAASMLCAITMTACGTTSLDPESYCTVDVDGANGYATAELEPDYQALALVFSSKAENSEDKLVSALYADLIRFEITSDKKEKLSNGDVIEVEVKYNKDALKQIGYSLSKDSFSYKVEGLEEVKELDPFKDLKISYTGYAPNAGIEIDSSGCEELIRQNIAFEYDRDLKVDNGDTFTVKAVCLSDKALLDAGYIMNNNTYQATVSGVQEAKQVDPFEGLEINFSGMSPQITADTDASGCDQFIRNNITFKPEKELYANGEKVKILVEYDKDSFSDNGLALSVEEKEFDIDSMPYYLEGYEGMDFTETDQELRDLVEAEFAEKGYYKEATVQSKTITYRMHAVDKYRLNEFELTPVKRIFAAAKDAGNEIQNKYIIVWKASIQAEKTDTKNHFNLSDKNPFGTILDLEFYATSSVRNVAANTDGSLNTDNTENIISMYILSSTGKADETTTVESICNRIKSNNSNEFSVSVSDYE